MPRNAASAGATSTSARNPTPQRGAKRKSTGHESVADAEAGGRKKARRSVPTEPEAPVQKPRLTTPDLEFDYDRSQLRDPRPTPGRERRPRLQDREVSEEFRQRFTIPQPPKPKRKPRGAEADEFFKQTTLLDPSAIFHDSYVCEKRGPHGPPTYDTAGFQLDYEKIIEHLKPQYYSKSRAVGGMQRALARGEREAREIAEAFFVEHKTDRPNGNGSAGYTAIVDYVRDHISKDLGIPWHQVGVPQAREWRRRGFPPKNFSEWWWEPTKEERRRMLKMMQGSRFRKDL